MENDEPSNKKNSKVPAIILAIIILAAIIGITVAFIPFFRKLATPAYQAEFTEWVTSLGIAGWLLVFGIQVVQIIIAILPGEPVELIAGALYGTWGGLFICLAGCILASSIAFLISRRFGTKLLYKLFGKEKVDGFAFLRNTGRIEMITFVLFFVPGTPKDMLTYVAGVSPIKLTRFLAIATLARIPSILTSTFAGATMRQGKWQVSLIVFAVTALIGIIGIKYHERIMDWVKSKKKPVDPPKEEEELR